MSAISSSTLSRLVPMLGSTHDGEVVAAARAIERKLKSEGRDWHYIAELVATSDLVAGIVAEAYRPKPASPNPGKPHPEYRPRKPRKPSWDNIRHHSRMSWMNTLEPLDWLTDADRQIVRDVRRKLHVGTMIDIGPHIRRRLTQLINKAMKLGVVVTP